MMGGGKKEDTGTSFRFGPTRSSIFAATLVTPPLCAQSPRGTRDSLSNSGEFYPSVQP